MSAGVETVLTVRSSANGMVRFTVTVTVTSDLWPITAEELTYLEAYTTSPPI